MAERDFTLSRKDLLISKAQHHIGDAIWKLDALAHGRTLTGMTPQDHLREAAAFLEEASVKEGEGR